MKSFTKSLLLVAALGVGLVTAGSILAHGLGGPGFGYMGGPGMMHNGVGGPGMMRNGPHGGYGPMGLGMMHGNPQGGSGPMAQWGANLEERLSALKSEIGITADQEAAWSKFADAVKAQVALAQGMHDLMWSQRGAGPGAAQNGLHQQMWQQRQQLSNAANELLGLLNPEQQQKARTLIGLGHFS